MRKLRVLALCLAVSGMLSGCGGSRTAPVPIPMDLYVEVNNSANDGEVFYMVVRTITDKQFMIDSYQDVAGLAFADPPDPSVLGTFALFPGKNQKFRVAKPLRDSLGLYFLFTKPSDQWKNIEDQPLAKGYRVFLGKDYVSINQKSLWPFQ